MNSLIYIAGYVTSHDNILFGVLFWLCGMNKVLIGVFIFHVNGGKDLLYISVMVSNYNAM